MLDSEIELAAEALYWRMRWQQSNPDVGWTTAQIQFDIVQNRISVPFNESDKEEIINKVEQMLKD